MEDDPTKTVVRKITPGAKLVIELTRPGKIEITFARTATPAVLMALDAIWREESRKPRMDTEGHG